MAFFRVAGVALITIRDCDTGQLPPLALTILLLVVVVRMVDKKGSFEEKGRK